MIELGRIGVWSAGLRFAEPAAIREAAAELEDLGYGALWLPGYAHAGTLDAARTLLDATRAMPVATGIVNIWIEGAATIAAQDQALRAQHPGRFLLGIGVSHGPLIGEAYKRPLSAVARYLDELDAAAPQLASDDRVIAALGPRMLELARERSAGSHPYLSTPEHTRIAREALGPDKLLAPELSVVLDTDPVAARASAREFLAPYMGMPNYMGNLRRSNGFEDADFLDGGSDRLVDAAVTWGDEQSIRRRVDEHLTAGADHVCIHVVGDWQAIDVEPYRRLAPALIG